MAPNTLLAWMDFLSAGDGQFEQDDLTLFVYGEGDSTHLVLEKQTSVTPWSVDQYIVLATGHENNLFGLVCFLEECKFAFEQVISRILGAEYIETPVDVKAQLKHVKVTLMRLKSA